MDGKAPSTGAPATAEPRVAAPLNPPPRRRRCRGALKGAAPCGPAFPRPAARRRCGCAPGPPRGPRRALHLHAAAAAGQWRGGAGRGGRGGPMATRGGAGVGRGGCGEPMGRRGGAAPGPPPPARGESSRRAGTERTPAPPQPEPRAAAAAMRLRGARSPPGKRGRATTPAPWPLPGLSPSPPPHPRSRGRYRGLPSSPPLPPPLPALGRGLGGTGPGYQPRPPGGLGLPRPVAGRDRGAPSPSRPVTGRFHRAGPGLPPAAAAAPGPAGTPPRPARPCGRYCPGRLEPPAQPGGLQRGDGTGPPPCAPARGSPGPAASRGSGGRRGPEPGPSGSCWPKPGFVPLCRGRPFSPGSRVCSPSPPPGGPPGEAQPVPRAAGSGGRGRAQPRG